MTTPGPQQPYQQPGQPYPPQEQPKKKGGCMKWVLIILGVIIVIAVIASIAGGGGDEETATEVDTTEPAEVQEEAAPADEPAAEPEQEAGESGLRWEAETSGGTPMDITYVGENFNITQQQGQASPWTATVDVDSKMDVMGANMSAQNTGGGDVTCRVYWDGELVNENTSSGEYAIATCSLPM